MVVYSNSCSFGAPQEHPTYADYVSEHFKASVVNHGLMNSCNQRIIRTTLRDLLELKKQHHDITALVGLSFISRVELWQPDLPAQRNDGHFHSICVDHQKIDWSLKGLIDTRVPNIHLMTDPAVRDYYKNWLIHYSPEAEISNLLTNLLMLSGWAKQHNINLLIFSNVDVLPAADAVGYDSPFLSTLVEEIRQDPSFVDPWQFSFGTYVLAHGFHPKDYQLYRQHGHPGQLAHEFFSKFLIDKLEKNSSCVTYTVQ